MAHIFISYHKNSSREYARKLADHLIASGFDVWIDDRIDYGTNWERVIFDAIKASAALIVIMTPGAYDSRWVQRERQYAESIGKPVFPLLLDGDIFPAYLIFQVAEVRGGSLPTEDFLNDLVSVGIERQANHPGRNIAEKVTPQATSKPHSPTPVATTPVMTTTPTQARRFEAAMPSQSVEKAATEIWAKISLPNSEGLRGELPAVVSSGDVIAKEDARATGFPFKFPRDPDTGEALPVTVSLRARSDALTFDSAEQQVELPPDFDSQTVVFNARLHADITPGTRVRVTLDLIYETRVIAQIAVSTFVESAARIQTAAAWVMAGAAIGTAAPPAPPHRVPESVPGEQMRGAVGQIELAEDDLELPPGRTREPALSVPPPPAMPEPQGKSAVDARAEGGSLPDYDEDYMERPSVSRKRSRSSTPTLALVASLALVAFVVILLTTNSPAALSSSDATGTAQNILMATQQSLIDPTQTQLAIILGATQTRAVLTTQTQAIIATQTARVATQTGIRATRAVQTAAPTNRSDAVNASRTAQFNATLSSIQTQTAVVATERAVTVNPVRVGLATTFEGCPDETSEQLQRRLDNGVTVDRLSRGRQDFYDLTGFVSRLDLVIWGFCEDDIMQLRLSVLNNAIPPELLDLREVSVSNGSDSYDFFAVAANAMIFYLSGDYLNAAVAFGDVLTDMPHPEQQAQFDLLKGNATLFMGAPEGALPLYERAASDLSLLPLAYNNRALAETEILLRDGIDNAPDGISVESVLNYLETAHQNTSEAFAQAVILTNIGLTTNYFTVNYDAARSRCADALIFNADYELAQVCLLAISGSEAATAERQCPFPETAVIALEQSLLASSTFRNSYAQADMLFWQAFLHGIWETCEPGLGFGETAETMRQQRAELLARQPILLQPDRFE